MLSLSWWADQRGLLPVLRWSPTVWRKIEATRDRIMRGVGSAEPLIQEREPALTRTVQWRKPLSFDEVNRMAPTMEVRQRPGRP